MRNISREMELEKEESGSCIGGLGLGRNQEFKLQCVRNNRTLFGRGVKLRLHDICPSYVFNANRVHFIKRYCV